MRPTIYIASFLVAAAPAAAQSSAKPDTAPPSPGAICADRDGDGRCDDTAVRGRDKDCARDPKDAACVPPPLVGGACVDGDHDGTCDPASKKNAKQRATAGAAGTAAGLWVRNVPRRKGGEGGRSRLKPPKPQAP